MSGGSSSSTRPSATASSRPAARMHGVEKVRLARQLERLGVDVIEAGFPDRLRRATSRPVRAVANEVRRRAVAGLCRTREEDIDARPAQALEGAARPRIHTFIATSDLHLAHKLEDVPRGGARARPSPRVALRAHASADEVEFSAEDASRSDSDFLARRSSRPSSRRARRSSTSPTRSATRSPTSIGEIFAELGARRPTGRHPLRPLPQRPRPRRRELARGRRGRRAAGRVHGQRHRRAGRATPRSRSSSWRSACGATGSASRPASNDRGDRDREPAPLRDHRRSAAAEQGRSSAGTPSPTRRASTSTASCKTR